MKKCTESELNDMQRHLNVILDARYTETKVRLQYSIGIAVATGVTAVVENSSAPRVYLCGSNMWKASELLKLCQFGEIIAERFIAKKFADVSFEVSQYGQTTCDNENVEYVIIKPEL